MTKFEFEYTACLKSGALTKGLKKADNEKQVMEWLDEKGLVVKSIGKVKPKRDMSMYAKDTPQSMAEEFVSLAELIGLKANRCAPQEDDSVAEANRRKDRLKKAYNDYRWSVGNWIELVKKYPNKDLPEISALPGNDYFAGMFNLADLCKKCAAILTGKTTADKADNGERDDAPTLTEDQTKILDYLDDEFPTVRHQQEIVAIFTSHRERKTIKNLLDNMMEKGLVSRPKNKARGYILTQFGREYHHKYYD